MRTPRVSSVAARVRFQCRTAPLASSLLSTSATGSGFSATRSSRRCILPMSATRKHRLASTPRPGRQQRADAIRGARQAARRHQFDSHIVEREQHAVGALAGILPGRRAPEQRLIGRLGRTDIADQSDDMIEAGDHHSPLLIGLEPTPKAARLSGLGDGPVDGRIPAPCPTSSAQSGTVLRIISANASDRNRC